MVPDGIDLSWSDNSANEQYFEVWRQDPDSTAVVAAPAADATTFTDTFTDPESRYKYRVRACNARGCSAWSPTITVNTPGETL